MVKKGSEVQNDSALTLILSQRERARVRGDGNRCQLFSGRHTHSVFLRGNFIEQSLKS